MNLSSVGNYLRIILVSVLIAMSGIAPRPHGANEALSKARNAIASGDLLEASQNLAAAGRFSPWRYPLFISAARFALEGGDAKSAIHYFELPGTISHLSEEDRLMLGDAYLEDGNPAMAEAMWKELSKTSGFRLAHERLLKLYLVRRYYKSAAQELINLLEINPSDIDRYYQLGSILAAIDPLRSLPYLAQAADLGSKDAPNAQLLYDKIHTANLFDNPAYTSLVAGRQLANAGNWELASIAFEHSIQLQPDYADAWAFLGEAYAQLATAEAGSISTAGLYELYHALKLDPDSTLANTFMSLHYERQQEYLQAQAYLDHAIQLNPSDSYLYSEMGNLLSKSGNLPAAQAAYEKAISLSPQEPLFYVLLAEFALQNQIQIREIALPAARHAVDLDPSDASSLDVMAQVMLALDDYHSGERFALDAVQADSHYTPAYLHLATAYIFLGKPDLARHWLDLAQTISPGSWVASTAKRMLEYYFP